MKKSLFLLFLLFHSFAYADYNWLRVETISAEGAVTPHLAINSSGNAVAIWMMRSRKGFTVQAAVKPFEQRWETAHDIASCKAAEDRPKQPKISLDEYDNATAFWIGLNAQGKEVLQTSFKPFLGEWSPPYSLSNHSEKRTQHFHDAQAEVALDLQGNLLVVWKRMHSQIESHLLFATKALGHDWNDGTYLTQEGIQDAVNLTINPLGSALLAWSHSPADKGEPRLQAITKTSDSSWQQTGDLSLFYKDSWLWKRDLGESNPALAIDSDGHSLVAWKGNKERIYVSEKSASSPNWSYPVCLSKVRKGNFFFYFAYEPKVAIDSLKNTTVLWIERENFEFILKYATKTKTGAWSSPKRITKIIADFRQPSPSLHVLVDKEGNLFVAWVQCLLDRYSVIQFITKPLEGDWSEPASLRFLDGAIGDLQMKMDEIGNVILLWEEATQSGEYFICSITGMKA